MVHVYIKGDWFDFLLAETFYTLDHKRFLKSNCRYHNSDQEQDIPGLHTPVVLSNMVLGGHFIAVATQPLHL